MKNSNYSYIPTLEPDGWKITHNDITVWGKTKAAARSRLLRMLKHNDKIAFENQVKQEKVYDQS